MSQELANEHSKSSSATGSNNRYLCFSLGDEEYAIPLLAVREVIAMPEVTPIPFSPPHFLGIMNLRGQVISVVDFRLKLGIKPQNSQETSVIICDLTTVCLGVVVDSINHVIAPSPTELSEKPQIHGSRSSEYITQVYRRQEDLILLIDIGKALGVDDINIASKATPKAA